ncbi:hypothetical protein CEQ90_19280 [Lewinellaceae bacterium SD302]|nr:hypothetical protein CEQ90_19280 [Lewinellaceae bacterium SD302]
MPGPTKKHQPIFYLISLCCLLILWFFPFHSTATLLAQEEIFLSTLNGELYSLDLADCDYQFVANMPVSSTDISFHPNGNFYALGSAGQLYEIDLTAGSSQLIYTFEANATQLYTALTISAEGIFYAAGLAGDLWRYSLDAGFGQLLGNIGFGAEGDLTFYEGELYMAATNDNIVNVNIQNPAQSTIAIDGSVSGRIFGIVSYAESCDSISVYALTNNAAVVYEVDLVNNELELYCAIPLQVSGGASTFEFLGSNPINIGEPEADDFTCDGSNGILDIPAFGGVGALSYSLDGVNYQDSPVFTDLPLDNYLIHVADEVGCVRTRPVSPNGGPLSVGLGIWNTSCGSQNGAINVTAVGGEAPYRYSLNGAPFTAQTFYDNLPPGDYNIVIEEVNGCQAEYSVSLEDSQELSIEDLGLIPASCGSSNGAINLSIAGGSEPYNIQLNGTPLTDEGQLQNLPAADYFIEVTDNNGCTLSIDTTVAGGPAVAVEITSVQPADCEANNGAIFYLLSGGSGPLRPLAGNLTTATLESVANLAPGQYFVGAADSLGCAALVNVSVPQNRCPVYVPNVFSPNLDGVNDYFEAYSAVSAETEIVHFRVFDRWGGLIFERLNGRLGDRDFRWDGTRSGKKLSSGTYLYSIGLRFVDGGTELLSGEVSLLR